MKNKMKRAVAVFTFLAIFMFSIPFTSLAATTDSFWTPTSSIDDFLLKVGTPQNVIDAMDESKKQLIFDTLSAGDISDTEFSSFEAKAYPFDENSESGITPFYISTSDLELSVVAYKQGTYNGYTQYAIYPSFRWKNDRHIDEDAFAFSLSSGWETVPQKRNLRLHYINPFNGNWEALGNIDSPCEANDYGYGFDGFGELCPYKYTYKGDAYMYAYKKSSSASHRIKIGYAHENSAGGIHIGGSIGITVGIFSISFSWPGDANIETREDIFTF